MQEPQDIRAFADMRIAQLLNEEGRYRTRLTAYRWMSWVCVAAGIVFPAIAGSALLAAPEFFGREGRARIGGALVLLAGILTGLHKAFKCEAYHEDARQRIHALRSLVEGYETTALVDGDELRARFDALESKREELRARPFDVPPAR